MVVIPPLVEERVTPHTEGLCAVVWHLLVSHPLLQRVPDQMGVDDQREGMAGRYLIVGGAGFIGSHFTDRLLGEPGTEAVTLYDNFSSGREWHYARWASDPRLTVIRADVREQERLVDAMRGHEVVIHLASNPDIARAVTEPAVDFDEGTAADPRGGRGDAPRRRGPRSSTRRAAACTATSASERRTRTTGRSSPSPRTAPASWPGRR